MIVKELPEIKEYIFSRNLEKQYKKAKDFLIAWELKIIDFKLRQPKKYQVYQFRISKKFRWFWIFRDTENYWKIFVIIEISDHQDF